jgi:enterobacterial common antigen flippase
LKTLPTDEAKTVDNSSGRDSSYGRILKSSSAIGGSRALSYAIGLFRIKAVALLLGPAGVGLIGLYSSVIELSKTVSGLGLANSGVREIASAIGQNDDELVGQLQLAIRRLAICLGVLSACVLALLSPFISSVVFGHPGKALAISFLGLMLVLQGINIAQTATIQGYRRVGALARLSILGAISSTIIAVVLYALLGESGIVPALIVMAGLTVAFSWYFARELWVKPVSSDWSTSRQHWRRLSTLGTAVAWGAMLGAAVPFFARSLIVRELGVEANGIYMAAWAISGLFAQFIIQAMSADFFPGLSAASHDEKEMNRLVNEQVEIGILIALPGILVTSVFASWVIQILYAPEFIYAATLLQWFLLGVFGRVISWPMGMLVLAKGHSKTFALLQSISVPIHIGWILLCFHFFGIEGAAMAFALQNIIYVPALLLFLNCKYKLTWAREVSKLLLISLIFLCLIQGGRVLGGESIAFYMVSSLILLVAVSYSLRELILRVGEHPKIKKILGRLPKSLLRILA